MKRYTVRYSYLDGWEDAYIIDREEDYDSREEAEAAIAAWDGGVCTDGEIWGTFADIVCNW